MPKCFKKELNLPIPMEDMQDGVKTSLRPPSWVLGKYAALFDEGSTAGAMDITSVHLEMKSYVVPKFCKARPVPIALQDEVANELRAMEADGILEQVRYSVWASPLVVVRKLKGGCAFALISK